MRYSPRRGPVPTGMLPAEAEAAAARVPVEPAAAVKAAHLSSHFALAGDVPTTYAAGLGRTGGAAAVAAAPLPAAASRVKTPAPGTSPRRRHGPGAIPDPRVMTRTEIRAVMAEPHITFHATAGGGGGGGGDDGGGAVTVLSDSLAPRGHPRPAEAHPGRAFRHLASSFAIHEMEPDSKVLLSRTRPAGGRADAPPPPPAATAAFGGGAASAAAAARARKSDLLSSHFSLSGGAT
jgi:hypothetical protein